MGIHERRDRQPRSVVARLRELTEQLHHLLREHSVAHRAALGPGRAVGLAADPPGEPERVEPIGLAVGRDRLRDRLPVDVGGHQAFVAPRDEQIGERDVPLPAVVRLIPTGAEPVTERRHRIGIQPHHGRVVVLLRRPSVCDTPCNDGYWPVNNVARTRCARRRPRVVPMELQPTLAQRFARAPSCSLRNFATAVVLVRRRVTLLIRHDQQNVRRRAG